MTILCLAWLESSMSHTGLLPPLHSAVLAEQELHFDFMVGYAHSKINVSK